MPNIEQVFAPANKVLPSRPPEGFDYPIVYVPGATQNNALRNRSENEAGFPIDQLEYNAILNKYIMGGQFPPGVAEQMAKQEIKNQPKWVPGEDRQPKRNLSPSSSVVRKVSITPENQIEVEFGTNPKKYTYRGGNNVAQAAKSVMDLLNSPSLEKSLNSKIPGSWGQLHSA